jgi:serine/threonine protein kinase
MNGFSGLVASKYRLEDKIGSGSFGEIYLASDVTSQTKVAVKFESAKAKFPQLVYESRLMRYLFGDPGIPNILWYGTD